MYISYKRNSKERIHLYLPVNVKSELSNFIYYLIQLFNLTLKYIHYLIKLYYI